MKNLFKQKSLKVCAISIVVSGMALVGYNAYSNATMTPEERLFQQNLEALTDIETNTSWKCQGATPNNNCSAYCGMCGTRIPATGKSNGYLTGTHSCSFK